MRRGFTLAELLITLGIIAVISALLGVAIAKLRPDKDKVTFLKQYDAVMNVTNKIVNNSRLYPICQKSDSETQIWDCRKHPLFNIAEASVGGRKVESGANKYCDILAMMLSGEKVADNSCTLNPTYADGAWTPTFVTKNGSEWLVSTNRSTAGDAENGYSATYQTDIYIDINGAKGPNCLYDKEACKSPDRFKLLVASDGTIIAADPMGQAYVNTRKNWNKKELDIAEGSVVVADLNSNLKNFQLNTCGENATSDGTHSCSAGTTWNATTGVCEPTTNDDPDGSHNCLDNETWDPAMNSCRPNPDPRCPADKPYYVTELEGLNTDACQAKKTLVITSNKIVLADYYGSSVQCSLNEWDFEVKAYPNVSADTIILWGYTTNIGNGRATLNQVQAEFGCKMLTGETQCNAYYYQTPVKDSSQKSYYTYWSNLNQDSPIIDDNLRDGFNQYFTKVLEGQKINARSNPDGNRSYTMVSFYDHQATFYNFVKIVSGENERRQVVYLGDQYVNACPKVQGSGWLFPNNLFRPDNYVIYVNN